MGYGIDQDIALSKAAEVVLCCRVGAEEQHVRRDLVDLGQPDQLEVGRSITIQAALAEAVSRTLSPAR